MTREQAIATFRSLCERWGLQWTASQGIPKADYDLLAEVNKVLDEDGRRAAVGLIPTRGASQ